MIITLKHMAFITCQALFRCIIHLILTVFRQVSLLGNHTQSLPTKYLPKHLRAGLLQLESIEEFSGNLDLVKML